MPTAAPGRWFTREWFQQAFENPLIRGGLTIGLGIVLGNLIGFVRVAVTAYLLGTHSLADTLAVAIGPIDTVNSVLINTMIFAFVPMLTRQQGRERAVLLRRASQLFVPIFVALTGSIIIFAPLLIRVLGPGLDPAYVPAAVNVLRITAISTLTAGVAALYSVLLFIERRFGPTAFYQASLNLFTVVSALLLWRVLGIYAFAVGYTAGSCVQLAVVYFASRSSWRALLADQSEVDAANEVVGHETAELLAKPGAFLVYAGLLAMNVLVTRAFATQAGTGMAAAFDYCMRCVNVVIAYLVSPVSNTLLPEIARLRSERRGAEAVRLMERTIGIAGALAIASLLAGIVLREPLIALLFQRGNFTAQSTELVSAVFLGFAPSLVGLSLLELMSRSMFAMDRRRLPVLVAAIPVTVNLALSEALRVFWPGLAARPEFIAGGASAGLLVAFVTLFVVNHQTRGELAVEARAVR
ncbi:MAG TPA: hypothetical protein DEQ47_15985 [Solibacterales bacterium]|nr:hypothetical protein [Bryobacterales bacterium]